MPELPDVEVYRRRLAGGGLHRCVERVELLDPELLSGTSAQRLSRSLRGRELVATHRHGKHLFAALSGGGQLVLHFGMTGVLQVGVEDKLPSYARLVLHLEDGRRVTMVDPRRLGFATLAEDITEYVAAAGLGPDALELEMAELRDRVRGRRGRIKSALMDQSLIAGIGNIYSDEILFQARIPPGSPAAGLADASCRRMYRQVQRVLGMAADRGADAARMPRTWLLPHRTAGTPCPRGNGTIRKLSLAGRGAYYCTGCQPDSQP